MKYRTNRLIKSYTRELYALASNRLRATSAFTGKWLRRFVAWLGLSWSESLLRRYFLCLGQDCWRSLILMRRSSVMLVCLIISGGMCLGFLVTSPHSPKANHAIRIDLNRPQITAVSSKERIGSKELSPYELAAIYQAGTGRASGWFSAGRLEGLEELGSALEDAQEYKIRQKKSGSSTWLSQRSPLGMENGRVVMRTKLGTTTIKNLADLRIESNITARPKQNMAVFAEGTANPESILAELSMQALAQNNSPAVATNAGEDAPRWQHGNYGIDLFKAKPRHWSGQELAENFSEERFCPQGRMEQASWLNMLYASHNRGSIYANKKAGHYRPYVERFAGHYSLPPSLVYAIMRVESGFNPLAVSHANALGLMQVVPETAGNEVHAFLRGKKIAPAPEILFKPESNIEYGTTYLHLLTTRHFKDVKNPISRELCIIAAYNAGPNSVFRIFSRNRAQSIEEINRLTPEQLYSTLLTKLSSQETRDYLPRVLSARNDFLRGSATVQ